MDIVPFRVVATDGANCRPDNLTVECGRCQGVSHDGFPKLPFERANVVSLGLHSNLGLLGESSIGHAYSRSGGAQYGKAVSAEDDILIVYAEAFDRDADPNEFSLKAIIAHECGHQVLARHPQLARLVAGRLTDAVEEVAASVVGALLSSNQNDRDNLIAKATVELVLRGADRDTATRQIEVLRKVLEMIL